jgi:trimeric autotransporter adhesin
MKKIFFFTLVTFFANNIIAQNVGIGTTTPNASALLDITAANKGLLIPRVALTDVNDIVTIPSPSASLLIYNTATSGIAPLNVTPCFYYWNTTVWVPFVTSDNSLKAGWLLGGNNNTTPTNNFIGNIDNQPLLFKIRNNNAGYLGLDGNTFWGYKSGINSGTGYSNVAIGGAALFQNTNRSNLVAVGDSALYNNGVGATTFSDATENTAIGSKALYANTIGAANTAIGKQTLFSNTTAINGTALGAKALYNNKTGNNNTALGVLSLFNNTTGHENTAVGVQALTNNIVGVGNTATGFQALFSDTSGNYNTASGYQSLVYNSSGVANTASGFQSMFFNTTGQSNVGIGDYVLYQNTDRSYLVAVGDYALYNNGLNTSQPYHATQNTALGSKALYSNTNGYFNTANGYHSLYFNTSGFGNTATGAEALGFNSIGNQNTANGNQSLFSNTKGNNNTALGFQAMALDTTGNNNTAIGSQSFFFNTSGSDNTATGLQSLNKNTTGNGNTAIGVQTLFVNTVGSNNVAVGNLTLNTNVTGTGNTAVGASADVNFSNLNNTTILGNGASSDISNSMIFGNSVVTSWAFGRTSVLAGNALQVGTNATNGNAAKLTLGGVWTNASDSTKKDNITKIDGADILFKLKQLPITRWKYKGTNEYHIGPMAQDFYKLFNVGTDDRSISSVDPAGIALKAIQEQQKIIDAQQKQIDDLIVQNKLIVSEIEKLKNKKKEKSTTNK